MIKAVLNALGKEGKIPETGAFEVTENLMLDYVFMYKILSKGKDVGSNSNAKFARRLAGINLLKENIDRGVKASEIKAGHTYLISNPAWPEHYKIGVSYDCHKRLQQYQTYSPYRDFQIQKYDFVLNKLDTEKLILNHPLIQREQGEWVKCENAKMIFDDIAKENMKQYKGCW